MEYDGIQGWSSRDNMLRYAASFGLRAEYEEQVTIRVRARNGVWYTARTMGDIETISRLIES